MNVLRQLLSSLGFEFALRGGVKLNDDRKLVFSTQWRIVKMTHDSLR